MSSLFVIGIFLCFFLAILLFSKKSPSLSDKVLGGVAYVHWRLPAELLSALSGLLGEIPAFGRSYPSFPDAFCAFFVFVRIGVRA